MNKPDHQAVKQAQVQVPTTDLLVQIVEPLSFDQKPEDFVPQKQLPEKAHQNLLQNGKIDNYTSGGKAKRLIGYLYLSFRRQLLQAVAKSTILAKLSTIPLSRSKKFSDC